MKTIELDDQTLAALRNRAEAQGMSVEGYIGALAGISQPPSAPADQVRDFDAALDELFASDTRPLPADSLTYSREDIYSDHD